MYSKVKHPNNIKHRYELLYNRKPNFHGYEPFGVPCTLLKTNNKTKFGEKVDDGYFLGYMPGSPNKRGFNTTAGKIDIAYNIEVTSYTHTKQTEPD